MITIPTGLLSDRLGAKKMIAMSIVGTVAPMMAAIVADSLGLFPIFTASIVIFFIGLVVLQFEVKVD